MLNKNDFKVFNIFIFFWLALGWLAFTLTLAGVFYWWILILFIALTIAFGFRFFLNPFLKISKTFIIVNISLFIVVIIFSIFTSPTIFSGRDQGSISESAIYLSQNGQLKFSNSVSESFFKINSTPEKKIAKCLEEEIINKKQSGTMEEKIRTFYCHTMASGKALNFPGFFYTPKGELVTQFPLVYISWLSFFYSFLGLTGLIIANSILFYIFLLSIFLISYKLTTDNKNKNNSLYPSIITLVLIVTSVSFSWFLKFTLTENMALALLWAGILQAIYLTESKSKDLFRKKINLAILLMSFGLLIFTRIEGIAFFIASLLVLLFNKNTGLYFRRNFIQAILPAIVFIALFFIWNLDANIYFFKAIAKSFVKDFSENSSTLDSGYTLFGLFKIFGIYGVLAPLLLGMTSIIYFFKKRNFQKLVPFFITLPAFVYILSPQITPDHPWMLRRYVFAVLPVSILYTSMLLYIFLSLKKYAKRATYYKVLLFIVIILNIPAFLYFFTYIPGENLLQETQKISYNFSEKDLILIDQKTSGDPKQMIGAPMNFLFKKNAVYFFNPNELKDLDTSTYEKVYLISPKENSKYYQEIFGDSLIPFEEYSIETKALISSNKFSLPEKRNIITTGDIFEIKK